MCDVYFNFMMPIISDLPLAMLKRKWMEEVTEMMLYVSTTSSMVRGPDSWLVRKVKYSYVGTGQWSSSQLASHCPSCTFHFQRN